MQMDEKLSKQVSCEDALVAIGDIATSGSLLQKVLASGVVSGRIAEACEELFSEIADLAGAADRANASNDA
ncbi:hypothetical protein GCM10022265_03360 [Marinobacter xestospongiae]